MDLMWKVASNKLCFDEAPAGRTSVMLEKGVSGHIIQGKSNTEKYP